MSSTDTTDVRGQLRRADKVMRDTEIHDLYKATALAVKSVDPALQVGGPSTARAQWVPELAAYCAENNAPLDFVSTHVYPGDSQDQLFGGSGQFAQADVISEAMRRVRRGMHAANLDALPLWLTEWSSDSPAMIGHVIAGCLPYCQACRSGR